jgi:hypoxanthine phosphoribosyltransferase
MNDMYSLKLLISEEKICDRVEELAVDIVKKLDGLPTILVGLLNGSVVFLSDLMRALSHHGMCPDVDFMIVSSYGMTKVTRGKVDVVQDIRLDIEGKTVLLIDDIVDTGTTLRHTIDFLKDKGAEDVVSCVLLDKPSRREVDISPDLCGFEIDNVFVVGYGLDYGNKYRCLPYIAELVESSE